MVYTIWFIKTVVSLAMKYFIAWPLTPIIVLFTDSQGNLPKGLSWFQTHDNTMDGDRDWKGIGKIPAKRPYPIQDTAFKQYWNRCHWIWRNSLYGFNERHLALAFDPPNEYLLVFGDKNVTSSPNGKAGVVKRYLYRLSDDGLVAWQYYRVKRFKNILKGRCLRINMGYKLWSWGNPKWPKGHSAFSIGFQKFY